MNNYVPQGGDMIAVKRFGYIHVGIYVGRPGVAGEVIHNDKGGGVVLTTLAEFSGGASVYLRKRVARNYFEQEAIVRRAFALLGAKFDLLTFNCEHAANWAQSGRQESPQLQGALFVLAILGLGLMASRG